MLTCSQRTFPHMALWRLVLLPWTCWSFLVPNCMKVHFSLWHPRLHYRLYNTPNSLTSTQTPARKRPYRYNNTHSPITQGKLMIQTRLSLGTCNINFTIPVAILKKKQRREKEINQENTLGAKLKWRPPKGKGLKLPRDGGLVSSKYIQQSWNQVESP